jgi:hypothetical protein
MPGEVGFSSTDSNEGSRQRHTVTLPNPNHGHDEIEVQSNEPQQGQYEEDAIASAENIKWSMRDENSPSTSTNSDGDSHGASNGAYFADEIISIPDKDSVVSKLAA